MIKKFLYRILCGFFLGLSLFAPGFSGSTIAIILGVYDDIVEITSNPFKRLKENIIFCIPIGIGAAISAVAFVLSFNMLFEKYKKATYLLFVGLICGNIPAMFSEVKKHKFEIKNIIGGALSFALALIVGILVIDPGNVNSTNGATTGYFMWSISGLVVGAFLLVPGMNIPMILILFGVYPDFLLITKSILGFEATYLTQFLMFAAGALAGVVLTSHAIKFAFKEYPGTANSISLGFMLGSLISLFITSLMMENINFNWFIGIIMLITGFAISLLLLVLGRKINKSASEVESF